MSTAGYSGTPLPRKLGIREGSRLLLVGPPEEFGAMLGELPAGVELVERARGPSTSRSCSLPMRRTCARASRRSPTRCSRPAGSGSPGRSAARASATDLDENLVREIGLAEGLVDNKVCAIDATWSGLRFVGAARLRAS